MSDLRQRLGEVGWRGQFVQSPYVFTDGRVFLSGTSIRRGQRLRLDALLRAEASLPIAAVQTLRSGESRTEAEQRLIEYAHNRLQLPFAYLIEDNGAIQEFDWTEGIQAVRTMRTALPRREELLKRWTAALGLTDEGARQELGFPYQAGAHRPRYYQEAAINRAAIAVLQARRGLRQPRVLLTLATGTGKTKVAFQLVWKLKRARAIRKVLFLADRDYLVGQAMDNEFAPFGDARHRIGGAANTSRDILFATYQAIAGDEQRRGLYQDYPRNFFDLIVVDECHRGSASEESNWRSILEHFEGAVQVGMTATPLRNDNVETYAYFGDPVYSYSLRAGISDGFLAPYRVRRLLMGATAEDEAHKQRGEASDEDGQSQAASPDVEETPQSLRERTGVIAEHLASYLRRTDALARTIVFCVDQEHAHRMREALECRLPDMAARYDDYVERIVSDEGAEGKRALGRFSTPDERTPAIVTTSKMLSTGVDVPTCKNVVLARPIGSMVEFKQIIGRGTRLFPPDKTWFTIIDYAGATRLFFDHDFDGDPELVEVETLVPVRPAADETTEASSGGASNGADPVAPPVETPSAPEPSAVAGQERGAEQDRTEAPANDVAVVTPPETKVDAEEAEVPVSSAGKPVGDPSAMAVTDEQTGNEGSAVDGDVDPKGQNNGAKNGAASRGIGEGGERSTGAEGHKPVVDNAPVTITPARDGRTIKVVGEIVYELGPDGTTLRTLSYSDYTRSALQGLVTTPAELGARWLRPEQRAEIRDRLMEEGVDFEALAASLRMPDADPFDLLLKIALGQQAMTRRGRAEKLRREHGDFFRRYGPPAREILNAVLEKYIAGEAPDVSDTQLLRVPPLSERGTFMELANRFGGGQFLRNALKEMHSLMYSA